MAVWNGRENWFWINVATFKFLYMYFENFANVFWTRWWITRSMKRKIIIASNGKNSIQDKCRFEWKFSFFLHPENFAKKFFEFDDGSSLELLDRIPFSVYISNISQKFLNFWRWIREKVDEQRNFFHCCIELHPKVPSSVYKRARKSDPTRDHDWIKATSFATMLQIGERILNGNKRCPIKGLCCNDNPIRKREGNCAWSLSIVRAHDCIRYRLWRTYRI